MKRGPKPDAPVWVRRWRILDDLREAYPNAIELRVLAAKHKVTELQIRRDIANLAPWYAVEQDDGEPFARGGRGPRRIVWAANKKAERRSLEISRERVA